jgi:hypothetical protein
MIVAATGYRVPSAPAVDERRRLIPLLLFEAAECWMALPAWEVTRLVPTVLDLWKTESQTARVPLELFDLASYFGMPSQVGLWIEWRRGEETRGLRVQRVFEVYPCPLRSLAPIPVWLKSAGCSGPFWAVGMYSEQIFLVLDPTRLAPV